MSFINYQTKEIHVAAVYFGAAGTPLEQNIDWVFKRTASPQARRIRWPGAGPFIDALPLSLGDIRGFHTRVYLATAKAELGEARHKVYCGLFHAPLAGGQAVPSFDNMPQHTRLAVDGVLFVADGAPDKAEVTRAAWVELRHELGQAGFDLFKLPRVVQVNVASAMPPAADPTPAIQKLLGLGPEPVVVADVVNGIGVFDALKLLAKQMLVELPRAPGNAAQRNRSS
jgi:mutual gliding-motility protein MglA